MFTIDEIIRATNGNLIQGIPKGRVRGVSIDSRQVKKGELFIAVKGELFDGHDFIADVLAKGVRVIVVHKPLSAPDPRAVLILVKDTTRALGDMARFHRRRFKIPVIVLTGSAGKTTTKEMIAAVLGRRYKVLKNEGTQNNHIGVPLTLLKIKPSHQMAVLECGTNQPGDIPWLADVARPDMAVFTNIGPSHLAKLKTPAGVLKEKWALTAYLPAGAKIVINADDPLLARQARSVGGEFQFISYGLQKPARFKGTKVQVKDGHCLQFMVSGKMVELNSCGTDNAYNALAAYACGLIFDVPAADIIAALNAFDFPKGRGQMLRLGRGWLVNDAYNANPVSMKLALQTLQAAGTSGQRILVAADMLELGAKSKILHRAAGAAIARANVDILITVGDLAALMAASARRRNKTMGVFACPDVEAAQKRLAQVFHNGDAVLVKGSRRMAMERVAEFLLTSPKGAT